MKVANKVGPLIGILTTKETSSNFYGNRTVFKKIQSRLQERGGISFVFTPEAIQEKKVEGYLFDQGIWRKYIFPLPDIIYNRIGSYHGERGKGIKLARKIAVRNAIPLYNPHFFEKWETYCILNANQTLAKYLPETEFLSNRDQFKRQLDKVKATFIKPVLSNRGAGTFVFSKEANFYKIQTNNWQKQFPFFEDAFEELQINVKARKMIIQEKITLKKYQGCPYDLRILVQRVKSNWTVSGIGVRLAKKDAITTHTKHGGKIIPLDVISDDLNFEVIEQLAKNVSTELEKGYGYLCEFSIDLGVDEANHYWILEINAKPMKFDEPHIQEKAIDTLIDCFCKDAGFS
ncbi:YheC/YheD family protein [Bacillaceae bacterium IKA-2]|nr:YheC/YheD family protein [Bacillaceae bacterium IKA-2]